MCVDTSAQIRADVSKIFCTVISKIRSRTMNFCSSFVNVKTQIFVNTCTMVVSMFRCFVPLYRQYHQKIGQYHDCTKNNRQYQHIRNICKLPTFFENIAISLMFSLNITISLNFSVSIMYHQKDKYHYITQICPNLGLNDGHARARMGDHVTKLISLHCL